MTNFSINYAINTKSTGSYFYSSSYEGFAGYCAVITEELADVSVKMKKNLNISEPPSQIQLFSQEQVDNFISSAQNSDYSSNFSDKVNTHNQQNLNPNSIISSKVNFSSVVTALNQNTNI